MSLLIQAALNAVNLERLDIIERSEIAIVAVLQANTDIQEITGRATGNITAWNAEMVNDTPIIAYRYIVGTQVGGLGDTREIVFSFSAIAPEEPVANALLNVIESILWAPALAALEPPLDGYMKNPVRRSIPWDSDVDLFRSDLELTLLVTK